jgi:hypothetical protein
MRVYRTKVGELLLAALASVCALHAGRAIAQEDAVVRANRNAYALAVKCFVADGTARGNNHDAGDEASASAFEKRARQAFDIASALADKLGYSGGRFNQDLGLAQTQELPKLVSNHVYFQETVATCKSVGL